MTHAVWTGSGTPPDPVEPGLPPDDLTFARMIEETADVMQSECRDLDTATFIVRQYDLNDDPAVMGALLQAIAQWTGSPDSSHAQMKRLHNLMADQLQAIAEREARKWTRT